ncbi:MAG: polysaccharide deacetylase family protein [Pseudomonadota bacterium]
MTRTRHSVEDRLEREAWSALTDELSVWSDAGRQATFWWRDDDATRAGPRLSRLLSLSEQHAAPVALASVPRDVDTSLKPALDSAPRAYVLQHGYAHINHAKGTDVSGAWEMGLQRPLEVVSGELEAGWQRLSDLVGPDRALPVLVPPWNRIDPVVTAHLPALGFRGVSTYGPRAACEVVPGLCQVNTHCDPIKWKGGARFTGTGKAVTFLTAHLAARRRGEVDPTEPTGLVTHHIDHDEAVWMFCDALLGILNAHSGARVLSPTEVFGI